MAKGPREMTEPKNANDENGMISLLTRRGYDDENKNKRGRDTGAAERDERRER